MNSISNAVSSLAASLGNLELPKPVQKAVIWGGAAVIALSTVHNRMAEATCFDSFDYVKQEFESTGQESRRITACDSMDSFGNDGGFCSEIGGTLYKNGTIVWDNMKP